MKPGRPARLVLLLLCLSLLLVEAAVNASLLDVVGRPREAHPLLVVSRLTAGLAASLVLLPLLARFGAVAAMGSGRRVAFLSLVGTGLLGLSASGQALVSTLPLERSELAARAAVWSVAHSVELREGRAAPNGSHPASHVLHASPEARAGLIYSLPAWPSEAAEDMMREMARGRMQARVGSAEEAWGGSWKAMVSEVEAAWRSYAARPRGREWTPPPGFPDLPPGLAREAFLRHPAVQSWWRDRIGLRDRRVVLHPGMGRSEWTRRVHGPVQDAALERAAEDMMSPPQDYAAGGRLRPQAVSASHVLNGLPVALSISALSMVALAWAAAAHLCALAGLRRRAALLVPALLVSIPFAAPLQAEGLTAFERWSGGLSSLVHPAGAEIRGLLFEAGGPDGEGTKNRGAARNWGTH